MVNGSKELALRMLADFDARTPGRLADEPIELTTAQAYELQARITRLREARGERVIGYKVGCTSRAIQAQLGVSEPIFGRVFDSGCHPTGKTISSACYANLAVEGELSVRLAHDLQGEHLTEEECRAAIANVMPVIELHHYVLPKNWHPGAWMIASNGLHAGVALPAGATSSSPFGYGARSLTLRIDDVIVGSVDDKESLARPITSLQWLARRFTHFGLKLCQGQLILTGSRLPLYPVSPGSHIVVEAPPFGECCAEIVS